MECSPDEGQIQDCETNGNLTQLPNSNNINGDRSSDLQDVPDIPAVNEQQLTPASIESTENAETEIAFAKLEGLDLSARYWGPTKDLEDAALVSLVESRIRSSGDDGEIKSWSMVVRQHGVYNSVYILESTGSDQKVCVRVPACAWSERWNEVEEQLFQCTARALRMLQAKTTVPIPRVIAYDCSFDNDIAAPFILMDCIRGVGARQVWNALDGAVPRETRRQNILRSIAEAMAGLKDLEYPSSGSLWFAQDSDIEPYIGKSYNPRVEGYVIKREFEVVEPHHSTREMVSDALRELLDTAAYPDSFRDYFTTGFFRLYQIVVDAFLMAADVPEHEEKFVLFHTDFDIQNMMVDNHGNLTGIFDWDGVSSQPRQIGWSMVPFWLQKDWSPGHAWPPAIGVDYAMVKPEDYDRYRQDYARYLWDACGGHDDCRFTTKSHIYRAFLNSLFDESAARRFVENVLADIVPRVKASVYCSQLGEYGFRAGEKEWLESRLYNFFKPEPPKVTHSTEE